MDEGFELPEDLAQDVEVIYLDDDELEEMDDYGDGAELDDAGGGDDSGIVEEINDISKLTFSKHQKSVFVCALSKDKSLAITGGEDDMGYLWDTNSGEVILECTGHKDSVTEVAFNHDDTLVATADMAGLIQVWSVGEKKLIWCMEGDEVEWIQWHHATNIIVVGTSSGHVYIYLVPTGTCKVLPSPGFAANCGKLLSDGKRVVIGYANGMVKLWDIKAIAAEWQYVDPNQTPINSLAINPECTIIVLCPTATVLKATDGKLLTTLLAEGATEVESCAFDNDLAVLATGSLSGQICVWDLGKLALRHQASIEFTITKLLFGKGDRLYIGASDGVIYICDSRTGFLVQTLTGHASEILDFVISADNETLVSTSDDGTAKVFCVKSA